MSIQRYIQKVRFACTIRKCGMPRGARKIVRKPLFIKIIRFCDVFSSPVVFFEKKF